jgi:hypothetical protein
MISACAERRFARTIAQKKAGGFVWRQKFGTESQEAGSILNLSTGVRTTSSSTRFRSNQAMRPEAANVRYPTKTVVVVSRFGGIRGGVRCESICPVFAIAADVAMRAGLKEVDLRILFV